MLRLSFTVMGCLFISEKFLRTIQNTRVFTCDFFVLAKLFQMLWQVFSFDDLITNAESFKIFGVSSLPVVLQHSRLEFPVFGHGAINGSVLSKNEALPRHLLSVQCFLSARFFLVVTSCCLQRERRDYSCPCWVCV